MTTFLRLGILLMLALPLSGCWVGSGPQACSGISEQKGQNLARASTKRFLQYVGKTHAPLTGTSGTLNFDRLESLNDSDLVYDGRSSNVYAFHLSWAPWAKFTTTVANNCGATTNWTID